MREILPGLLWIGNAGDLRDPSATLAHGVSAVVDLAASEPPATFPRDIIYCRIPLCDGAENSAATLGLAVSTVKQLLYGRVPTLVACSMGLSRSPAIAAAAMAGFERRTLEETLARIATTGPLDVDPALWSDLQRRFAPAPRPSPGISLGLLVIRTEQLERVVSFYQSLGFAFVAEQHGNGPVHHTTYLGTTVFEIYPAMSTAEVNSATRLGFRVADIPSLIEQLRTTGTTIIAEPKAGPWGMRAVVRDPDDRTVELYDNRETV